MLCRNSLPFLFLMAFLQLKYGAHTEDHEQQKNTAGAIALIIELVHHIFKKQAHAEKNTRLLLVLLQVPFNGRQKKKKKIPKPTNIKRKPE